MGRRSYLAAALAAFTVAMAGHYLWSTACYYDDLGPTFVPTTLPWVG